jgi:glutamate racemase
VVIARACPLFVPLVEEGWLNTEATRLIAREYLAPLASAGIDALVLGCTHYPLLRPTIAAVLPGVTLIDSAEETARATALALEQAGLGASVSARGVHRFIASDAPEQFLTAARRFLADTHAVEAVEQHSFG